MIRAALALLLALAPVAAPAQLDLRPRTSDAPRGGADDALRRTVALVLRAEARQGGLPPFMIDPEPLPEALQTLLVPGFRLPPDFPAAAAPERVDRRLPHTGDSSVWAVAGTWMIEVDPVRLTVLTVAPDVLPPDI